MGEAMPTERRSRVGSSIGGVRQTSKVDDGGEVIRGRVGAFDGGSDSASLSEESREYGFI